MSRGRLIIVGGGQSGLAAARAWREKGWEPVVLEAGQEPVGSWPRYYDSLHLFSPRRFSAFPGHSFPGDPDGYPGRDEVVDYLRGYARSLDVEFRTGARVVDVAADGPSFAVDLADGSGLVGDALVAASGSFGNPHVPTMPGLEAFGGSVLHVAGYRSPEDFSGQRVVVVGAGNSAVQVAHELAEHAKTSLAVRDRVRFAPQVIAGRDLHWWLRVSRADLLPPSVLERLVTGTPVIDAGKYQKALEAGRPDQRPMFTAFTPDGVVWPDGSRERIDAVVFATGYRPHLPYLRSLGVLDGSGSPKHERGVATGLSGVGFLGLEFQRSFSSNTLRGVHRDADYVVGALARQARGAAVA
ncbi:flavin-containing monooxygenase [Enemella evansiae]|uniref:FAD-dependent oxidoreductase n=1 Tax=Enemella evansiae TaxID=2016499 RepID=A0A255GNY5_9ACTN|nr:NAD(P)/FAD-dependent oxidoreductase [Enemella evansiae]OYO14031.1 FAD-dependent oxidoreductase [Enemella evansiae]OYO17530.1 FAD-dependent oxidoreductase [Enemella evansiae]TDO89557.1 putative flavoprotein involved in K+ transport [Enemella evansiae]